MSNRIFGWFLEERGGKRPFIGDVQILFAMCYNVNMPTFFVKAKIFLVVIAN
jgi:hypothetical protein